MKDRDVRSFIASERLRFVNYARSLVRGTADMDAEDIVHDVLIKILDRADLPAPEQLAAYIYRSLRNRVIDKLRTRKPTVSLDAENDEGNGRFIDLLRDGRPDALEILQAQEGREELFEALEGLAEMEKEVIIAHEFEGIPFKELAESWGVPQNTLLSHKSRAMKKLKQHFQDSKGDRS